MRTRVILGLTLFAIACGSPPVAAPPATTQASPIVRVQTEANTIELPPSDDKRWCWTALPALPDDEDLPSPAAGHISLVTAKNDLWLAWTGQAGHLARWHEGAWEKISLEGMYVVLASDSAGDVVATTSVNGDKQSELHVEQRSNSSWTSLGVLEAFADPFTNAGDNDVLLDAHGNPIVAWTESKPGGGGGGPHVLRVARHSKDAWVPMGDQLDDDAQDVHLALDGEMNPWVAWRHGGMRSTTIRVAHFDGTRFADMSPPQQPPRGVLSLSLAMVGGEAPSIAFWDLNGERPGKHAFLLRSDERWISTEPPGSGSIALATRNDGSVVAAWSTTTVDQIDSVTMSRLTRDGWKEIVSGANLEPGDTDTRGVAIVNHGEGIYLAWGEDGSDGHSMRVIDVMPCAKDQTAQPFVASPLRSSLWPKTVGEAVDILLRDLAPEVKEKIRTTSRKDLIQFHFGLGMGIRNRFGLWQGNKDLAVSCGSVDIHPDSCSMKIIEALWEKLQQKGRVKNP